ncbi:MAG: L-threonylcarbamoyladenylate synthase [Pseudomonadota bacterium]
MHTTRRLTATPEGIAEAAALLQSSELVAFPTETVYGLGAVAHDPKAVAGIYAAKGRPSFNPLIVHVSDTDMARSLVRWNDEASVLSDAFWPGPLTMVLPQATGSDIAPGVTAGLDTLAVRCPRHPLAQKLIEQTGAPLAAPSANPSGAISPTTADHVLAGLNGHITALLDGGPCDVGLESTIVDLSGSPTILREGGVTREALEHVLGPVPAFEPTSPDRPTSPGQLSSHYAPRAKLRLDVDSAETGEVWLGFGGGAETWSLSPTGDLAEAAASLFDTLHRMDTAGVQRIAVSPIPNHGLGAAINDRLRRAAAPRP